MNKNSNKRKRIRKPTARKYKYIYKRRQPFYHQEYTHVIKTAIVTYVTPTYTQANLQFRLYDLLIATEVFQQIAKNYSQFLLEKVTFFSIPRQIGGTDPSPCWIYLDTNGNNQNFNYEAIQELQGSKRLPVKHLGMTTYSSTGRQNDFKYWYDMQDQQNPDVTIRLHSEALPNTSKFWQFQIGFKVHFRGFIVPVSQNNKKEGTEQIVKLTSESHIENEEEDEDEIWNHVDSDVE